MENKYYYSALTNAFYPSSLIPHYKEAGSLPSDLLEISEHWYNYLLSGQSKGKVIQANEYGQPVVVARPAPTLEELQAEYIATKSSLMAVANNAIEILQDAIRFNLVTDEEREKLQEWQKYRVYLNRIDVKSGTEFEWPSVPQ